MTLVTLQRQAPVAPDARTCRLCDGTIAGTYQDHLLIGEPGTATVCAVLCQRCGEALVRLADLCGKSLGIVIQDPNPSVANLVGLPRAAEQRAREQPNELTQTRQRLTEEADTLSRTERALRAEANKLGSLASEEPR
jgi:hypothetical protein